LSNIQQDPSLSNEADYDKLSVTSAKTLNLKLPTQTLVLVPTDITAELEKLQQRFNYTAEKKMQKEQELRDEKKRKSRERSSAGRSRSKATDRKVSVSFQNQLLLKGIMP